MPDDLISRAEAKAAIDSMLQRRQKTLGKFRTGTLLRDVYKGGVDALKSALTALDAVPAAEGRWETLRKWLPVVAEDWDRAGMPQKKFAVAYIIDKMDQIDAVIAAPSPPAGEKAEGAPALIRAKPRKNAGHAWMWRAGSMWVPLQGTYNRVSRELFDVDRASSTPAALALYDADLTSRGDAAQRERE